MTLFVILDGYFTQGGCERSKEWRTLVVNMRDIVFLRFSFLKIKLTQKNCRLPMYLTVGYLANDTVFVHFSSKCFDVLKIYLFFVTMKVAYIIMIDAS